jgi:hypothetical protein
MAAKKDWIGCMHTREGMNIYWPERKRESAAATPCFYLCMNCVQLIGANLTLRHLRCFELLPYKQETMNQKGQNHRNRNGFHADE